MVNISIAKSNNYEYLNCVFPSQSQNHKNLYSQTIVAITAIKFSDLEDYYNYTCIL